MRKLVPFDTRRWADLRLVTLHQRASRKSLPEPLLSLVWGEYFWKYWNVDESKNIQAVKSWGNFKIWVPALFSHLFSVPNAYFSSKFSAKYWPLLLSPTDGAADSDVTEPGPGQSQSRSHNSAFCEEFLEIIRALCRRPAACSVWAPALMAGAWAGQSEAWMRTEWPIRGRGLAGSRRGPCKGTISDVSTDLGWGQKYVYIFWEIYICCGHEAPQPWLAPCPAHERGMRNCNCLSEW